ncbi:hypothetical protein ACQ4PT_024455 [Festuca glaucescens]
MTDLLVIRSSPSYPSLQDFGASSPAAARDDDVERTPTKPKENRPSDPVSRTMKAVLSCSPGNPKYQHKMKVRALRRGTRVQHALALAFQCSSKPSSPVSKQAAGGMTGLSPRKSPRVRISKQWQQRNDVQGGSNAQEAEKPVSPRKSPRVRISKKWQQRKDVQGGTNAQEAEEAYAEGYSPLLGDKSGNEANVATVDRGSNTQEDGLLLGYKRQSTGIDLSCADDNELDNKTDNCLDVNLAVDQSSPPGTLLEVTSRWTGEKRAKVLASPPTSEVAHYKQVDDPRDEDEFWDVYDDPQQLNEVQERLALYRIKAHEITYICWESYHTTCTTLKCDQEFLQFYEELSSKLKSVEDDDVEPDKEHFDAQRTRYEVKAHIEAPKIASRFSSIYADLVHMGITDCTWSAMFDLTYHKDLDNVFFEIWKRVAKDKYYAHVAHIDDKVPEDEVVVLIKEAVNKILPKPLVYADYIRKKLAVAKEIGVIP